MAGIRTEITLTTDDKETAVLAAWNPTGLGAAIGKVAREQLKTVGDWLNRTSKAAVFTPSDVAAGRAHLDVVTYWADVLGQHESEAAVEFRTATDQACL